MNLKSGRIALAAGIAICVNGGLLLVLFLLNRPFQNLSSPDPVLDLTPPVLLSEPLEAPVSPLSPPKPPRLPEPKHQSPMEPTLVFEEPTLAPLETIPVPAVPIPQATVVSSQQVVTPPKPPTAQTEPATDEILDAEGIDSPPRGESQVRPRYPAVARHLGREGEVKLKLLINGRGRVEQIQVLDVIGHRSFERAVLAVARQWRFSPPLHQGRPVRVWALKKVKFQLKD